MDSITESDVKVIVQEHIDAKVTPNMVLREGCIERHKIIDKEVLDMKTTVECIRSKLSRLYVLLIGALISIITTLVAVLLK